MYKICLKFLKCNKVSAQEAIYIIFGMPLSRCSRSTIFINTGKKERRIKLLKGKSELMHMPSDSTDMMGYQWLIRLLHV